MRYLIFTFLLFLYIVDSKTILQGVSNGLILWYQTLIPALAPFLLLSSLLKTYRITASSRHRLFYPVCLGIFSGFPAGAKVICDCIEQGSLTKEEGQCLLPVCNNPSMGYCLCLLAPALGFTRFPIAVWLCMVGSGGIISCLLYCHACHRTAAHKFAAHEFTAHARTKEEHAAHIHEHTTHAAHTPAATSISFTAAFDQGVISTAKTLLLIAGYVTIFTISGMFLANIPFLPIRLRIFLQSMMEITTGTLNLKLLAVSNMKKTVLGGFANGFGGFSSLAQTAGIICRYELSWSRYLISKLLQGILFTAFLLMLSFLNIQVG